MKKVTLRRTASGRFKLSLKARGADVAMEVAANVGTGGVGSQDWGVQGRIAARSASRA